MLAGLLCLVADVAAQEGRPVLYALTPGKPEDTAAIAAHIARAQQITGTQPDSAIALLRVALYRSGQALYPAGIRKGLQAILPLLSGPEGEALLQRELWLCRHTVALEPALDVIYSGLGKLMQLREQYDKAGIHYLNAIPVAVKYHPDYLATVYNNYGALLSLLPDSVLNVQRSMYYLDKAQEIAGRDNNFRILTCVYCNKAKLLRSLKRYPESLELAYRALALAQREHFIQWEMVALNNIGDLYFNMGQPDKAIPYLERSLKIEGTGIAPYYRNMAVFTLGEVYYTLNDMERAKRYFSLSLDFAREFGISRDLIESNRKLAQIYAALGDYNKAFHHQVTYSHMSDSFRNHEVIQNVQQLEVKFRTSEKDRELLRNKLQMEHQEQALHRKNTIVALSVAFALLAALVCLFLYNRFRQKRKLMLRDEQIREMRALIQGEEQERIRLAQELHDGIGGMLAAVNMNMQAARKDEFSHKQELLDVMQMIEDTTDELRKTAHNLMPSALLRKNLGEALQYYCDTISHRSGFCIDLHRHGDLEAINPVYVNMLFRIVQELIQNVIRHAGADHVIVSLEKENDRISLMVEDNGRGFDTDNRGFGFGLENLEYRVRTLGGNLNIQSESGVGTCIMVTFARKDVTLSATGA
ncbi:tetratricopeptide repeat-containing sensor histidine kinase [Taibaiella koreensis]|uniref:tetratricopeptide repeat-containing sensor histidine kinase n=1 Tax=Taibaiella koreensis TaxID=1268548 RepID=UPI000E59C69C|nr:sensor histidine kinase [Taibaiella koreensis]